jgi:hypothetical protein
LALAADRLARSHGFLRGQVFSDQGPWNTNDGRDTAAPTAKGDFNANGHVSAMATVGASVR